MGYVIVCIIFIVIQIDKNYLGWVLGIFVIVLIIGLLIGLIVGGYIELILGFKSIFIIIGGLLFVLFIIFILFVVDNFKFKEIKELIFIFKE